MSVDEGQQSIQGLLPDGTLVPINLLIQEGKGVTAEILAPQMKNIKPEENTGSVSQIF